jgi:transposase-like protein
MSRCWGAMALTQRLRFCRNSARNVISQRLSFSLFNSAIGLPLPDYGWPARVNYTERNLIEKWFHTLKMRVDPFHNSWGAVGQASASILNSLCINTTATDRTKLSMEKR